MIADYATKAQSQYSPASIRTELTEHGAIVFANDKPLGMIDHGEFVYTDPRNLSIFKEWMSTLSSVEASETEDAFRNRVADHLRDSGWSVVTEVPANGGRIDILARRGDEQIIVEVKTSTHAHAASHALGQLLFYRQSCPDASLWFIAPQMPSDSVLATLAVNGVNFLGR